MASSESGPVSFLHLPLEVRTIVYDLAFTPVAYGNLLDPKTFVYTKEAAPLLHVHPIISADLHHRLYRDGFAIVLPFQEPSEFTKGRGLSDETLKTCLNDLPKLMKQRCNKLIVEASQTREVLEDWDPECGRDKDTWEPDVDYEFWEDEAFAARLVPRLLEIKKEMLALKKVHFIFWIAEWIAPMESWRDQLQALAEGWNAHRENETAELSTTNRSDLELTMQLNLFDYGDPDAGDGGSNWIQRWDAHANEIRNTGEGQEINFVAMDVELKDHLNGNFEAREFDPRGWEDPYIMLMGEEEMDTLLHKYLNFTTTCRPLYVKAVEDGFDPSVKR
ncbi:hypothetical protein FDECE_644 [Fusarium decemcellulare]|nr:hypothetical protein FDECE_644 [Fusarium decemcellulare]